MRVRFRPIAVVQLWSSDQQLWMIAAGLYGFVAMIQFAKSARPTQLSSEHGSLAEPLAGWAESSIVRTAAQPRQGCLVCLDLEDAVDAELRCATFFVTVPPWFYSLHCMPGKPKALQLECARFPSRRDELFVRGDEVEFVAEQYQIEPHELVAVGVKNVDAT